LYTKKQLDVWDLEKEELKTRFEGAHVGFELLHAMKDGVHFLTCGPLNEKIKKWSYEKRECVQVYEKSPGRNGYISQLDEVLYVDKAEQRVDAWDINEQKLAFRKIDIPYLCKFVIKILKY
jgi:hypothetical protein